MPNQDLAPFIGGAAWIIEDPRERIRKRRQRFGEGDAMLPDVALSLPRVPLEFQAHRRVPERRRLLAREGPEGQAEDAGDVVAGFGVRGDAAETLDGGLAGIVGGDG